MCMCLGVPPEQDRWCPGHRHRREAKVAKAVDSSRESVLSQRCQLSQVPGVFIHHPVMNATKTLCTQVQLRFFFSAVSSDWTDRLLFANGVKEHVLNVNFVFSNPTEHRVTKLNTNLPVCSLISCIVCDFSRQEQSIIQEVDISVRKRSKMKR